MFSKFKNWCLLTRPSAIKLVFGCLFYAISKLCLVFISFLVSQIISLIEIAGLEKAKDVAYFIMLISFCFALFETLGFILAKSEEKQLKTKLEKALVFACFNNKENNATNAISCLKDINNVSAFFKHFMLFIGSVVALIAVMAVLFYASALIFIMALTLGIICLIIYVFLSNLIAKNNSKKSSAETETNMHLLGLLDGANFAYDNSKEQALYENFKQKSALFNKTHSKEDFALLLYNSGVLLVWHIGISLIIIYMVGLLKYDYLSNNLFIVCVPYLVLLISLFSNLSAFFTNLNTTNNCTSNLFLFLSNTTPLNFGKNKTDKIKGTLEVTNATFYKNEKPLLNDISFNAKNGQIVALEFANNASYLAFCLILRRKSSLDKGNISIDNINIKDFEKETYSKNLTIIMASLFFEDLSIINYLKTTGASQNKIDSFLKETGIKNLLKKDGLNLFSNIKSVLNKDLLYVLSVCFAYFVGAEIMVFLGLWPITDANVKKVFLRLIKKIKKERTMVILTTCAPFLPTTNYYKIDAFGKLKTLN